MRPPHGKLTLYAGGGEARKIYIMLRCPSFAKQTKCVRSSRGEKPQSCQLRAFSKSLCIYLSASYIDESSEIIHQRYELC